MTASAIDDRTEQALLEIFEARAHFLDRCGDDPESLATWSRCLRTISQYQLPADVKAKMLGRESIPESIVAEVEARWICEYPVGNE